MNKSKRYSLREWMIRKLGGITPQEWKAECKAEFDRHIITTPARVSKYTVTLGFVLPPGMVDDVPPIVKERLAAKLADGLMESGAVHIEPYQINIVHTREKARHMRYVATLYICEKERTVHNYIFDPETCRLRKVLPADADNIRGESTEARARI